MSSKPKAAAKGGSRKVQSAAAEPVEDVQMNLEDNQEDAEDQFLGSYLTRDYDPQEAATPSGYICGSCSHVNQPNPGDAVSCVKCGFRVLYKRRQRRPMLFYAR